MYSVDGQLIRCLEGYSTKTPIHVLRERGYHPPHAEWGFIFSFHPHIGFTSNYSRSACVTGWRARGEGWRALVKMMEGTETLRARHRGVQTNMHVTWTTAHTDCYVFCSIRQPRLCTCFKKHLPKAALSNSIQPKGYLGGSCCVHALGAGQVVWAIVLCCSLCVFHHTHALGTRRLLLLLLCCSPAAACWSVLLP